MKRQLWAAFSMATSASFLLAGYEFARSSSNTLFKAEFGASRIALANTLMPVGLVTCLWLYGRAIGFFGARKTLFVTYLFSGIILGLGYICVTIGVPSFIGVVFIFRKIYVVILIEQYWSFINSHVNTQNAKRLNGAILGIASIGPILGGYAVGFLAERLGTSAMLLFAVGCLIPSAVISDLGYRICGEPAPEPKEVGSRGLRLDMLKGSPLLLGLLLIIIMTQILSAVLEINFQTILQDAIPDGNKQTAYSGNFFGLLNAISFVLQFVAAPILLKLLPVSLIHAIIPLIHLGVGFWVLRVPSLAAAGSALMTFKAIDYSVFRAAKEIFYIPLSFDARYRAKQVVDVFGYRGGEGLGSAVLVLFQKFGFLSTSVYGTVAQVASCLWLIFLYPTLRSPNLETYDAM